MQQFAENAEGVYCSEDSVPLDTIEVRLFPGHMERGPACRRAAKSQYQCWDHVPCTSLCMPSRAD